jgi:hypothetical protein
MTYENLYSLTPRAFWNALDGFWTQKENEQRKEWERTRWQTCLLLNVHLPKNKQIGIKKLVTFDWEKRDDIDTYETTKQAYERYKKLKRAR